MAPVIFPSVGLSQVHMLEQGTENARAGTQPGRTTCSVEVVLVLEGNLIAVDVRIHEAVGRISGDGHQAAKVGNQHGIRAC